MGMVKELLITAYDTGVEAFNSYGDEAENSNPYPQDTEHNKILHCEWDEGFKKTQADFYDFCADQDQAMLAYCDGKSWMH